MMVPCELYLSYRNDFGRMNDNLFLLKESKYAFLIIQAYIIAFISPFSVGTVFLNVKI